MQCIHFACSTDVKILLFQIRVGCYAGGGMGESWRPVGPPPPPRLLPRGGAPWPRPHRHPPTPWPRPLPGGEPWPRPHRPPPTPWPRPHRPPSPPPGRGRRVKGTQNRQWVFHICLCKHFMRILLKFLLIGLTRIRCTDKKSLIFLVYKEIQNGAVAKSYLTNGLLIYGEISAHFLIY